MNSGLIFMRWTPIRLQMKDNVPPVSSLITKSIKCKKKHQQSKIIKGNFQCEEVHYAVGCQGQGHPPKLFHTHHCLFHFVSWPQWRQKNMVGRSHLLPLTCWQLFWKVNTNTQTPAKSCPHHCRYVCTHTSGPGAHFLPPVCIKLKKSSWPWLP